VFLVALEDRFGGPDFLPERQESSAAIVGEVEKNLSSVAFRA
jgi:hypothetical protein